MARKRYHMFIKNGSLTAVRNSIKDSILDPRGGGLKSFSLSLNGGSWWGASWVMEETGLNTISFEVFENDIIDALTLQHNTGNPATKIATYVHEDEFPGLSPRAGFDLALADIVKKDEVLVIDEVQEAKGIFRRMVDRVRTFLGV